MRCAAYRVPFAAALAVLAAAVPAVAASGSAPSNLNPSPGAPKTCGASPSGSYVIRVNAGTPCAFGKATYRAFVAALSADNGALNHQLSEEPDGAFNFTLKVHSTTLDCRANGLAHDEFDIYCNDLNRYRNHVVDLVNATEPDYRLAPRRSATTPTGRSARNERAVAG